MKPRYRVTLTSQEREELEALTKTNKTNARQFPYARTLLSAPFISRLSAIFFHCI